LKKILYPQYYWNCVIDYATLNNLDPYLVFALIREESRFKERAYSRVGARGLMQIMPGTGRWISRQLSMSYYKTRDLFVPRINIKMGTWYLSYLKHKHNNNLMLTLASYNGGFMNVMKWVKKFKTKDIDEFVELIPFRETKNYVKKVMKSFNIYKQIYDNGYNIELTSNDSSSSYSDTIQY
jgi:soluble lytic murein transglycosylase